MELNIEQIAQVAHEANSAFCRTIGDNSQFSWAEAPEWQRKSAVVGVQFRIDNPDAPASATHDSWLESKRADGWKFGPIKDADKKEHPCFVPYEELPLDQQLKDYLFGAVVSAFVKASI